MGHQHKQPTPITDLNPDVPEELVAVVERLMQKNPEAALRQRAEVIEALEPLAARSPRADRGRPTMDMPRVKLARPGMGESSANINLPPNATPRTNARPRSQK